MSSEPLIPGFRFRMRGFAGILKGLSLIGLASLSFSFLQCDSSTDPGQSAAAPDTIKFISPAKGAKWKMTDTALIIFEIDTTLFNRNGLYFAFSLDSGKCWEPGCYQGGTLPAYKIKPGKGAVRRDTIIWVLADEPFLKAGQNVKLRLKDYPPGTMQRISDFFTLTD
jgi:hypothetical protein